MLTRFSARWFLLFALACAAVMSQAAEGPRQYFELRVYTTKSEQQQTAIAEYWQKAAIPACNRAGIKPIGVFTELEPSATNKVYVLLPYDSLEAFAALPAKLLADAEHAKAGADYLNRAKSEPAYVRYESSLSLAFEGQQRITVPASAAEQKTWIFELRTYESHSETKGNNKVQMFNSGEIPLMNETGLSPVFFGQTITGSRMPNLVYMVSGENKEAHAQHWKAFFAAPVWKKLIGDPQYKDNVSKVHSVFLKRCPGSQI